MPGWEPSPVADSHLLDWKEMGFPAMAVMVWAKLEAGSNPSRARGLKPLPPFENLVFREQPVVHVLVSWASRLAPKEVSTLLDLFADGNLLGGFPSRRRGGALDVDGLLGTSA